MREGLPETEIIVSGCDLTPLEDAPPVPQEIADDTQTATLDESVGPMKAGKYNTGPGVGGVNGEVDATSEEGCSPKVCSLGSPRGGVLGLHLRQLQRPPPPLHK